MKDEYERFVEDRYKGLMEEYINIIDKNKESKFDDFCWSKFIYFRNIEQELINENESIEVLK